MIQIKQFSPVPSEKTGLKEDIKFRVSELAPYIEALLPSRLASKLEGEGTFRRLTASELEQKAKNNSTLYVDIGVNSAAPIITGDAGLAPASQTQVQSELQRFFGNPVDEALVQEISAIPESQRTSIQIQELREAQQRIESSLIRKKNNELSSLIILRRRQDSLEAAKIGAPSNSFLVYKIENSKKGEVLEIEESVGFPYLFLGRPKESRIKRVLEKDLLELVSPSSFIGESFLTVVVSDVSQVASSATKPYFFEIERVINPAQMTINIIFTSAPPSSVNGIVECVVTGVNNLEVLFRFNKETPPTADQIYNVFRASRAIDFLDISLLSSTGSGAIASPSFTAGEQVISTGLVTNQAGFSTSFAGGNNDVKFVKKPSTIKIRPTNFSKADPSGRLFSSEVETIIRQTPLFHAIAGAPILRKSRVGDDLPTLEEYAELIRREVPLTSIYAPVTTEQGLPGRFLGNLDLSSLNVTLHDDDGSAMLIQNGEAQPGSSVQYKLHREPNLEEEIEIGDVDVTIKLSSPPARVPIRGELVRGAQEIALGVNIATTPGRLTPLGSGAAKTNIAEGSIADVATAGLGPKLDKFQDKIGEAVKNYSKAPPAKGEYYFNFQAKNAQGESINLNKYGTIRIFDEVVFSYLDSNGRPITLQKTSIIGIIEANNTIAIKDPITALPPPKATVLVEIPQTPLNPGRKYRITVSCQDKEA